jgi:hypothetical protein
VVTKDFQWSGAQANADEIWLGHSPYSLTGANVSIVGLLAMKGRLPGYPQNQPAEFGPHQRVAVEPRDDRFGWERRVFSQLVVRDNFTDSRALADRRSYDVAKVSHLNKGIGAVVKKRQGFGIAVLKRSPIDRLD